MSNFDKAVEIIGELATEYGQPGGDELFGLDEDAALALKEAGLLAPDVQIIRTPEELEALDPDAVTVDNEETIENANMWLDDSGKPYPHDERFLPAAVLATGAQFRAALEAMEQDNE